MREEETRELSPAEAAKGKRVVFVMRLGEKAPREFVRNGAGLLGVIPGGGRRDGGANLEGSWLSFEGP